MELLKIFAKSIKEQVNNAQGQAGTGDLQGGVGNVINIVFALVGVAAVIVVILGGVSYLTSQGDPSKVTKGKNMLITGLVGLIIVLLAFAIVNLVLTSMQ